MASSVWGDTLAAGVACAAVVVAAGGKTYGTALAAVFSNSMTTVLRALRTRYRTGAASVTRTREVGALNDSVGSTATETIGLLGFAVTELATPSAETFLKSRSSVSGS